MSKPKKIKVTSPLEGTSTRVLRQTLTEAGQQWNSKSAPKPVEQWETYLHLEAWPPRVKPCPECDSEDVLFQMNKLDSHQFRLKCSGDGYGCGFTSKACPSMNAAIDDWNGQPAADSDAKYVATPPRPAESKVSGGSDPARLAKEQQPLDLLFRVNNTVWPLTHTTLLTLLTLTDGKARLVVGVNNGAQASELHLPFDHVVEAEQCVSQIMAAWTKVLNHVFQQR